ncbi:MAG: hypothetical protein JXL67_10400 [Calditrichaeota bacterium]|nr:hypothetical protein [Calditrichota bacterium]RQV92530.1 MAG: hypothetical protein EH221_11330 [bacterium]
MIRILRKFFHGILFIAPVFLLFCSENPHELTVNILENQFTGSVKDTTLFVVEDTTYLITQRVSTRSSLRLLIGKAEGLEARPILRFADFSTVPDTATIDSAWIKLYADGFISSATSNLTFRATIYPVDSAWISNTDALWDDIEQNIDRSMPLGETDITPGDTTEYIFNLNSDGLDLVRFWADTGTVVGNNAGIYIDFNQADFLQYIYAINPGSGLPDPELIVAYSIANDTAAYRDTLSANFDAFIYDGEISLMNNRNYVSSLIEYNTLLKFNLREFVNSQPGEIAIISANIQVPLDLENSLVDDKYGLNPQVGIRMISPIDEDNVEVDSTAGRFTIISKWAEDSSYVEVNSNDNRKKLATLIKDHLNTSGAAEGFVISFLGSTSSSAPLTHPVDFYSYLAYFSRENVPIEKRARLVITYWIPAESRL